MRRRLVPGGSKPEEIIYVRQYGVYVDDKHDWEWYNTPYEAAKRVEEILPTLAKHKTVAACVEDRIKE